MSDTEGSSTDSGAEAPVREVLTLGEVDCAALIAGRMARVQELMGRLRLDHVILTSPDQIRYATDRRIAFVSDAYDWSAAIVSADGATTFFVPEVERETSCVPGEGSGMTGPSLVPIPSWSPSVLHPGVWARSIGSRLRRFGARRVGFDRLPSRLLEGLVERTSSTEFVPVEYELFELRAVKMPEEIRLLEMASELNVLAVRHALRTVKPGMRDYELMASIAASQLSRGAEAVTHLECSTEPGGDGWSPVGYELREGDVFFVDAGCYGAGGYASDIARSCCVGAPRPEVIRAHKILLDAYELGKAAIRPGVAVSVVAETINGYLIEHGLAGTPYGMGHGVGLRSCELPTLEARGLLDQERAFEPGNVVAVEPETRLTTSSGVVVLKVEEDLVVEQSGVRELFPDRELASL